MSAMSASSAAPAGLMPLSLIAEHKTAQPPPAVQSLPRSGNDKCVNPSNIAKPTANGMEGPGPLPLVSQLPQTTASMPAMPDLSAQHNTNPTPNSDIGVQPPVSHPYQSSHQNLLKPTEPGSAQEGSGAPFMGSSGIVSSILSGERRLTEETTVQHHHMSSTTTTSTFSAMSTTTVEHSRSGITGATAQLLQLQPSQQPGVHQTPSTGVSSDTPTSSSSSAVANTVQKTTESSGGTASTTPGTTTVTHTEESTTRVQESTTTQITTLESTTLHKPTVQHSSGVENVTTTLQVTTTQPAEKAQTQNETPSTITASSPPKSTTQHQVTQQNAGNGANPATPTSTQQSTPSTGSTTATSSSAQPPSMDNSTLKVATIPRQASKRVTKGGASSTPPAAPLETSKKSTAPEPTREKESSDVGDKPRRKRLPTQPYQSPIPELNIIAKYKKMKELNEKDKVEKRPSNSSSDKLIVFYRNEFLAVRNAEGGFYVCQAVQNVYKSSTRIRIRWLSQQPDPSSDLFTPDFYDHTEFDCILTNLNLERVEKDKFRLPQTENRRTESILKRALDVEKGVAPPPADDTLTETHPDGLDLSLYRNEEQLKRRKKSKKKSGRKKDIDSGEDNKRGTSSSTKRRAGAGGGSTVSASAVSKAKKAAAIKRTAAVKRVVQQAAAARRQASSAVSSMGSNKKPSTTTVTISNKTSPVIPPKKDTKVHSSPGVNKRKAPTVPQGTVSVAPEKRTRRGTPSAQQQNQSAPQNTTAIPAPGKTRGATVVSGNSNANNKNTSSGGGGGTNANTNNGTTTAGNTRRTLRNSK